MSEDVLFSSVSLGSVFSVDDFVFRLGQVLTKTAPQDVLFNYRNEYSPSMGRSKGLTSEELFAFEQDRYKFYLQDIRSRNGDPTDLLYDFTAKSMATLDYMKERVRNSPHNHALMYPMVKMTEVVMNSLDKIHKQTEGSKSVVEHRIYADLEGVTKRVNADLKKKRLDYLQSQAVDAEIFVSPSIDSSGTVVVDGFDSSV